MEEVLAAYHPLPLDGKSPPPNSRASASADFCVQGSRAREGTFGPEEHWAGRTSLPPSLSGFILLWLERYVQEKRRRGEELNRIRPFGCKRGSMLKNTAYWSPSLPGKCSKSLLILKRHYRNICFNILCADSLWQAKEHVLTRTVSASGSALAQKLEQLVRGQRLNLQESSLQGQDTGWRNSYVGGALHTLASDPTISLTPFVSMWSARS